MLEINQQQVSSEQTITASLVKPWELVKQSFDFTHKHWKQLFKTLLLPLLLFVAFYVLLVAFYFGLGLFLGKLQLQGVLAGRGFFEAHSFLIGLPFTTISHFLTIFLSTCPLLYVYDSISNLKEFQNSFHLYKKALRVLLPIFWAGLLLRLLTFGSVVLLIVPGVFLGLATIFYSLFIISGKARGIDALVLSWSIVRGRWWKVLGRVVLMSLVIFLPIAGVFFVVLIPISFLTPFIVLFAKSISSFVLAIAAVIFGLLILVILIFVQSYIISLASTAFWILFDSLSKTALPFDDLWRKRKTNALWTFVFMGLFVVGLWFIVLLPKLQAWREQHINAAEKSSLIDQPLASEVSTPELKGDKSLLESQPYTDASKSYIINLPLHWSVSEEDSNQVIFMPPDLHTVADFRIYSKKNPTPITEEDRGRIVRDTKNRVLGLPGAKILGQNKAFAEFAIPDPSDSTKIIKVQTYFYFNDYNFYMISARASGAQTDNLLALLRTSIGTFAPIEKASQSSIFYKDTELGISLRYPSGWKITTSAKDRETYPGLVDFFEARDLSDNFLENFSIYVDKSDGVSFTKYIDQARNNLRANVTKMISESNTTVAGKPAYKFEFLETVPSVDSRIDYPVKSFSYLINAGDKYFSIQYRDQVSTFEDTIKNFEAVIQSIKFQ